MVFKNREEAGRELAKKLTLLRDKFTIFAIPRGGVPVGCQVAKTLSLPFEVIVVRKIPIPSNPEAGFGAVTEDGTIVLNDKLVKQFQLKRSLINREASKVRKEIERRAFVYRHGKKLLSVKGLKCIITDDGLASGYTMLAAIRSLRKLGAEYVVVAVPTAHQQAAKLATQEADRFITLNMSRRSFFAVADYYEEWRDLTDEEIVRYLKKAGSRKQELGTRN